MREILLISCIGAKSSWETQWAPSITEWEPYTNLGIHSFLLPGSKLMQVIQTNWKPSRILQCQVSDEKYFGGRSSRVERGNVYGSPLHTLDEEVLFLWLPWLALYWAINMTHSRSYRPLSLGSVGSHARSISVSPRIQSRNERHEGKPNCQAQAGVSHGNTTQILVATSLKGGSDDLTVNKASLYRDNELNVGTWSHPCLDGYSLNGPATQIERWLGIPQKSRSTDWETNNGDCQLTRKSEWTGVTSIQFSTLRWAAQPHREDF